ncbi:imidazolonepropionase [Nitrospirillum iridis]|uniref:Imidazolonepropionase n=1 Tax=Nitrospirillum iridis TaxID=765888 RepID=A0A7X0AXF0_9PROT|nr:imidazolonepropionase [Nitrospirillum iridis]MBB6250870.1 imidazolonepropionase [Nitrospirillum iridis]
MPPAPPADFLPARHPWDTLWVNAHLATMTAGAASPYGAIENGAVAAKDGRIAWVGPLADLPGRAEDLAASVQDAGGAWITPGLIDCHTHLVFGGERVTEFELRLTGASYSEISRAGGGIAHTVRATRAASDDTLYTLAARRLTALMAGGVTTVEIKSGYGLDLEHELRLLRVARRLGANFPITVHTTLLGAHALPPGVNDAPGRARYLDLVCDAMIPLAAAEDLADAVDVFCEGIAFTPEETARVFDAAQAQGLAVKLHADQLSDTGGAALAARYQALSADHLEYTSDDGLDAMAAAGTVAVLLPGAFHMLRETKLPPIAGMRARGIPMAIATDCNPGTSPALSLPLMMSLACTHFRLTPEEALAGCTRHAAQALGLGASKGQLAVGFDADLALWDITRPAELAYWLGGNACVGRVAGGRLD